MKKCLGILALATALLVSGSSFAAEYEVPVKLMKAYEASESMGNGAIIDKAKVKEEDGKSEIYISLKGLNFMNMYGHLLSMKVYPSMDFTDKSALKDTEILETKTEDGLSGTGTFPSLIRIKRDKTRESEIGVRVTVDAMEELAKAQNPDGYNLGDGSQDARIVLDYSKAKEINPAPTPNPNPSPNPDPKPDTESKGYIDGYENGTFKPDKDMTRAEASKVLAIALGTNFNKDADYSGNFRDVGSDAWYYKFVSYMETNSYIKGKGENIFDPESPVTRAEFVTMVANMKGLNGSDEGKFGDVSGHWAESKINDAVKSGWIKGYDENTFGPDNNITRAEVVTIINRVKELNVDKERIENNESEYKEFSDLNSEHWAYYDVLAASK